MLSLIDSHIHLDAPELEGQGSTVLAAAHRSGIDRLVIPGVRASGWDGLFKLTANQGVFAAPGLHPAYAEQWSDAAAAALGLLAQNPRSVAIGEIGLDGVCGPDLGLQEKVLRAQLQIALDSGLPVLLHGRKATGRLLEVLRELAIGRQVGGIWHGFSGSLPVAQELARLGFKLGVGPILLRESARKLPQAVVELPAAALVLETDLPDMAAEPQALVAVAQKVAELRGWTLEEAARVTTENALSLFPGME